MPRRLLLVIPRWMPGSAELQAWSIARRMAATCEVHVVHGPGSEPVPSTADDGITWHGLPGSRWWGAIEPWAFHQLLRTLRPVVVHLFRHTRVLGAATVSTLMSGVTSIVDLRLSDVSPSWTRSQFEREIRRRTRRMTTSAPWARRPAGDSGRTVFVDDHDDVQFTSMTERLVAQRDQLRCAKRQQFGLRPEDFVAIVAGNLHRRKRVRDAIWAADLLKVVRSDVYLWVVGDGPDQSGLRQFRELVRIEDRVRFLGRRSDWPELLAAADWLWATSECEDYPWSVSQAMQVGIPVIASDIPAHRSLIEDGVSGWLFPVGDRAGAARATYAILENVSGATQRILVARETWASRRTQLRSLAESTGIAASSIEQLYQGIALE